MVAFDGTRLHQDSVLALGAFDRDNEYLVLGMRKVDASTGVEISAVMLSMMEENDSLVDNTRCFMTDRCPAQVRANQLLVEKINLKRNGTNLCFQVPCYMHTTLRGDASSNDELSEEAKSIQNALKMSFGGRKQDNWRRNCLKAALKEAQGGEPSEFVSDIGSRFKVNEQNGKTLLIRENEVEDVIKASSKTAIHHRLGAAMDDAAWPRIRLELQVPVVIWNAILGEFHSKISQKLTYSEAKAAFRRALNQIEDIQRAQDQFGRALIIAGIREYGDDSATPKALSLLEPLWKYTVENTPDVANSIEATFRAACEAVKKKFVKDFRLSADLPIPDDTVLWWTNRRVVSYTILIFEQYLFLPRKARLHT